MDNLRCGRQCDVINRPSYIVLFKGDDSDFQGNQSVDIVIDTELDTTGMKAHFRFMDFVQDFNSIPENKTLSLVFPNAKTSEFPLGAADATLRFEDASGKFRTVSNRIHIVVTNSVHEAYDNEDSQSITVTVKGTVTWNMIEGKPVFAPVATSGSYNDLTDKPTIPAPVTIDPALSPTSENPVQNKVVTKALYTGFTEWEFSGVPEGVTDVSLSWNGTTWSYTYVIGTHTYRGVLPIRVTPYDGNELSLTFPISSSTVTATRHLITPTKTSQLTNDGAPNGGGTPYATTAQIPSVPSAYTSTPAMDGVGSAGSSTAWARGDHVHPSDTSKLDGAAASHDWSEAPSGIYIEGDVVTYGGRIWRHTSRKTNNNPPGPSNADWEEITIGMWKQDALSPSQRDAVNSGATAEKVATWDGYAMQIAQKASLSDLPYALVTLSEWQFSGSGYDPSKTYAIVSSYDEVTGYVYVLYIDGVQAFALYTPSPMDVIDYSLYDITATRAYALHDRSVNVVSVTGAMTITLPALVNAGKARDFLVRLEISGSTVPTITFAAPTGETIVYETDGDEFPVPDEAGTWLYSFTETAAHTFAVALKSVSVVTQGGS